jgi:Zn-dependent protease with chaperone function
MTDAIALPRSLVSVATLAPVVTLAAFGSVYLVARAAALLWRPHPTHRAGLLFARGVAPAAAAGAIALGVVLPAFLRFEPPHDGERAGALLLLLSAVGGLQLARMIVRAARMLRLSRALTSRWAASAVRLDDRRWGRPAFAVDAGFPLVAVSGLFRPRVFVDRSVLANCSATELDAIAAHERAHVLRRDNVRRLIIGACEGPASVTARAWREAAERAADAHAASSPRRAVDLASALLKMARLAQPYTFERTALSTIHDSGSLETRVRRLVAINRPLPQEARANAALAALLPLALLIGLNWSTLLRSAHALTEAAVRNLP